MKLICTIATITALNQFLDIPALAHRSFEEKVFSFGLLWFVGAMVLSFILELKDKLLTKLDK